MQSDFGDLNANPQGCKIYHTEQSSITTPDQQQNTHHHQQQQPYQQQEQQQQQQRRGKSISEYLHARSRPQNVELAEQYGFSAHIPKTSVYNHRVQAHQMQHRRKKLLSDEERQQAQQQPEQQQQFTSRNEKQQQEIVGRVVGARQVVNNNNNRARTPTAPAAAAACATTTIVTKQFSVVDVAKRRAPIKDPILACELLNKQRIHSKHFQILTAGRRLIREARERAAARAKQLVLLEESGEGAAKEDNDVAGDEKTRMSLAVGSESDGVLF